MATSTTIKLPDALKARVARAAETNGISPHAFMLDAIESGTRRAEEDEAFLADAEAAEAEVQETGVAYTMESVHKYIRAKAAGKAARRPSPKRVDR